MIIDDDRDFGINSLEHLLGSLADPKDCAGAIDDDRGRGLPRPARLAWLFGRAASTGTGHHCREKEQPPQAICSIHPLTFLLIDLTRPGNVPRYPGAQTPLMPGVAFDRGETAIHCNRET